MAKPIDTTMKVSTPFTAEWLVEIETDASVADWNRTYSVGKYRIIRSKPPKPNAANIERWIARQSTA